MQTFIPMQMQNHINRQQPANRAPFWRTKMKTSAFTYFLFPFLVFLGGCCFGPSSSVIKLAYEAGFSAETVLFTQYVFSVLFMLLLSAGFFIFSLVRKNRKEKTVYRAKDIIKLVLIGICIALTSLNYVFALQTIPAHLAVILLFQYTWMGIIAESVIKRKAPSFPIVLSVVILIGATLLASGVGSVPLEGISIQGIVFGLLSAAAYAAYIQLNASLDNGMTPAYRSLATLAVALLLITIVFTPYYFAPEFIADVVFGKDLWIFGLILGSFGCALPNILFAIGAPKIPAGSGTILSSSELPASIICAVIIISEAVTALQWIGVALLFFGIALPYLVEILRKRHKNMPLPQH